MDFTLPDLDAIASLVLMCVLLPQSPPNFLHAASLAKHVKPVVVIPDNDEPEQQEDDDDDPEPLIEVSNTSAPVHSQPQVRLHHRCSNVASQSVI